MMGLVGVSKLRLLYVFVGNAQCNLQHEVPGEGEPSQEWPPAESMSGGNEESEDEYRAQSFQESHSLLTSVLQSGQ